MRTTLARSTLFLLVVAMTSTPVVARASTLDLLRKRLAELPGTMAVRGRIDLAVDANSTKEPIKRGGATFDCDPL